jgi:uncharacterized membrane protein YeiB
VPSARAISPARETLVRRGYFLFFIGYLNLTIWQGDILRIYGVSLAVAAGLIAASDRRLLAVASGFVLGFIVLFVTVDYEKNWDWSTMTYHHLWTAQGVVRNLFYDGFRSVFPWTGLLIFGIWLGRRDLTDRATNTRLLLTTVGTAILAELISWRCLGYLRAHPHGMDDDTMKALFGTESMPPLPLFLLSSGGSAVAIIALCVRVADTWPKALWLGPLVAMGQLALTWYFFHIIFGLGSVDAAGLSTTQPLPVAQACGVAFFAAAVFLSWLWKRRFGRGPLEWLMRRLAG